LPNSATPEERNEIQVHVFGPPPWPSAWSECVGSLQNQGVSGLNRPARSRVPLRFASRLRPAARQRSARVGLPGVDSSRGRTCQTRRCSPHPAHLLPHAGLPAHQTSPPNPPLPGPARSVLGASCKGCRSRERGARSSAFFSPPPLYIPRALGTEGSSRRRRGPQGPRGAGGRPVTCELVENVLHAGGGELGAAGRSPLGLEGRERA